jgi:hypothetical protein
MMPVPFQASGSSDHRVYLRNERALFDDAVMQSADGTVLA